MAKNTRRRVSKGDWLAQALEILAAEGEGASASSGWRAISMLRKAGFTGIL